jgi:hypothetical protein
VTAPEPDRAELLRRIRTWNQGLARMRVPPFITVEEAVVLPLDNLRQVARAAGDHYTAVMHALAGCV